MQLPDSTEAYNATLSATMEENEITTRSTQPFKNISEVQFITYTIGFPLLILLGLTSNSICLAVLLKSRMRSWSINKYFLFLSSTEVILCLMHIPIAVTTNGCSIISFSAAYYYGHFSWAMIGVWQTMRAYILVFMSFDRYQALWHYQSFRRQETNKIFRYRIASIVAAVVLLHINCFTNVNISCLDGETTDKPCEPSRYVIEDSFQTNYGQSWHSLYVYVHEIGGRWLPGLLLLTFNIGVVAGIMKRRVTKGELTGRKNERDSRFTVTMLVITISFIICNVPLGVYLSVYSLHVKNKCYGKHEVLRGIGNILQLLEPSLSIVFLASLNLNFREELVRLFTRATYDKQNENPVQVNLSNINIARVKPHCQVSSESEI